MHITPELRNLTHPPVKENTVFEAFGYILDVRLKKTPQFLDLDNSKSIFFFHEYGIYIRKPLDYPLNMYQHFKVSNEADDVSHFKLIFENKFSNNFEYIKSSFYSKPTLLAIFKSIEEVTLLFYQMNDKWMHSLTGYHPSKRIYYFEAENCKGFQVGDPALSKVVILWLFPDPNKEIEIKIQGVEIGKVKQEDIDLIITTFKKLDKNSI